VRLQTSCSKGCQNPTPCWTRTDPSKTQSTMGTVLSIYTADYILYINLVFLIDGHITPSGLPRLPLLSWQSICSEISSKVYESHIILDAASPKSCQVIPQSCIGLQPPQLQFRRANSWVSLRKPLPHRHPQLSLVRVYIYILRLIYI
jgi:hypothetical protein